MKKLAILLFILPIVLWIIGFVLTYNQLEGYDGPEPVATNFTVMVMVFITAILAHTIYVMIWTFFSKKQEHDWTTSVESFKDYYRGLFQQVKKNIINGIGSIILFFVVIAMSLAGSTFYIIGLVPFDFMQNRPMAYVWTTLLGLSLALSLFIFSTWLITVVKKTTFKHARFLYLVKMAPFLIYVLTVLTFSGGDYGKLIPFSSGDSGSIWDTAGTCSKLTGSMVKPDEMIPAHASVNERVDEIKVDFSTSMLPKSINKSTIQLYTINEAGTKEVVETAVKLIDSNTMALIIPVNPLLKSDKPEVYTVLFKALIRGDFFEESLDRDCHASFIVGDPESDEVKILQDELLKELEYKKGDNGNSVKIL